MFYGDLISDICVMQRFLLQGDYAFAVTNCLAILAGFISAAWLGVDDGDDLAAAPFAVLVQSIGLFGVAIDGSGTDPRYKSSMAICETRLLPFSPSQRQVRHLQSWNLLTIFPVRCSIGSIVKSFSNLDMRGHVSRTINGQGIVVG